MIKNIIFDFGNVLLEWNEDKVVSNYSNKKDEQEILKKEQKGTYPNCILKTFFA